MDAASTTEQQHLDHLYQKALAAGETLLVWAGGDAKSQALTYTSAFSQRFPDLPISALVELSKYHDATLEYRLLTGGQVPDVIHLQALQDYDYWKEEGVTERYRPLGLDEVVWDKSLPLGRSGHIFPEGLI